MRFEWFVAQRYLRSPYRPAVHQTVLLSFAGQARGVVTKGIDPERERKSDEALQRIVAGGLDFSPDADGIDALLIGRQLAQEWKVSPGDYVTLTSPQGRLTSFGLMPREFSIPAFMTTTRTGVS